MPANGFNYAKLTETRLFFDDAGADIVASTIAADSSSPQAGDLYAPSGGYATYRCTSVTYSQTDSKTVTASVEYTNMPAVVGGSSSAPQSVDVSQPGYCSMSSTYYTVFQDAYKRTNYFPFVSPEEEATDKGYVSCMGGKSMGEGNMDSGGSPVSFPVLHKDVVVSLTRYVADHTAANYDPIDWAAVRNNVGTRNLGSTLFLGTSHGSMLFRGATVVRSYEQTGTVNYELQFTASAAYHMQQVPGAFNEDGTVKLVKVEADSCGTEVTYHAADVKIIQPFTAVGWSGMIATNELALLNSWVEDNTPP